MGKLAGDLCFQVAVCDGVWNGIGLVVLTNLACILIRICLVSKSLRVCMVWDKWWGVVIFFMCFGALVMIRAWPCDTSVNGHAPCCTNIERTK